MSTTSYATEIVEHRQLISGAQKDESIIYVAAMHAATAIYDICNQRLNDFSLYIKKPYFIYSKILVPADAPLWCQDRCLLWNRLETANKKSAIPIATEIKLSMPAGRTNEIYIKHTTEFAAAELISKSCIVDIGIHLSRPDDPHAHFLIPHFVPADEAFTPHVINFNLSEIEKKWLYLIQTL